jgi:tetratricopeptide (TPR) repeat protein
MDILYTVEEKYLQAIEELHYGELPKALHYFNEIIETEPGYARAYYQLGCFYHYQFKNYQTAGYYYKKCIELEAEFPDVYEHYLRLLILLKLDKSIETAAEKALSIPGVCKANIYESLGVYQEEQRQFDKAKAHYSAAALATSSQTDHSLIQDHLKRIEEKKNAAKSMTYAYQGN